MKRFVKELASYVKSDYRRYASPEYGKQKAQEIDKIVRQKERGYITDMEAVWLICREYGFPESD